MSLKKSIKSIFNPKKAINYLMDTKLFVFLPDKIFIKMKYKTRTGKKLDLSNVSTFNEKLQWLKLNNRKDIYTTMVDKYEAKKFVSRVLGDKYIIPTLGIYNSFDEIDFSKLPNKFVIKCTHDSGGLIIVKDINELDMKKAKKKISKSLKNNYYYHSREWPYKNVKPRIIVEKYMEDNLNEQINDYKFFCFNGKVEYFKIDFDRFVKHGANYYDKNAILQKFGEEVCPPNYNKKLNMPINLKLMISFAEKLSYNIPFLRVDFYEVNGDIYFGELTFFPASGFGKFIPESADVDLGKKLKILDNISMGDE